MTTRIAIGLSSAGKGYDCGVEVARIAKQRLGRHPVSLALLFTSHDQPAQVLKGVNATLDNPPLLGATAAGQYSHDGYVEEGAGLMLISSPDIRFHPLIYRRRWFGGSKLLGDLSGTSDAGLGSEYLHRTLMLFPDDRSMNLDGVVDKAMSETGMLYDIFGGPGPTIPAPPRPPAIFYNRHMLRAGLVGAEVLSTEPVGLSLENGWKPISGPYRVTKIEKRSVVTIDGRPAREVYEDFFDEQGIGYNNEIPGELLLKHPIGICEGVNCKVSVLMGFDHRGALQVTSPPPERSLIHILGTQPTAMTGAAGRAIQRALLGINGRNPAGLLFIDCMSTAMVLQDAYAQQHEAVLQAVGDLPFLGFRSHGVLARLQGQITGHYECSVATWILPE